MKVHHLDCGSMRTPTAPLVCHVLLVETDNGLVLVDAGYGLDDIASPGSRVGWVRHLVRPTFDPEQTAVRQVERLGFHRDDVRHIVLTHFDVDHVGGISDFARARIHVTSAEWLAATMTPTWLERARYRRTQWAHGPDIVEHDPSGEKWRGFAAAKDLDEIASGIVLVSVPGHTRGHACIAVDAGHRWVLHCGDCFYHRGTIDGGSHIPRVLRALERAVAFDHVTVQDNHARLAALYARGEPDLMIVNAHDPALLGRAQTTA